MIFNAMTHDQLVTVQVDAQQAQSSNMLDFTVGSVLLAISESNADVGVWLQGQIIALLALTRAATSEGADLDSFYADYGFTRLAAFTASGEVTFSRFSPTQDAIIYPGNTVQSADGSQGYAVTADDSHLLWRSDIGGYMVPTGTATATLPIVADLAGAYGNIAAGVVSVITSPIPNIDTVTNADALTNGKDPESDAAFRARFVQWVASLERGTMAAVKYAVASVQQGMVSSIVENYDYDGNVTPGFFYVVIDDGTGAPSATVQGLARASIEATRPMTSSFQIYAPVIVLANVTMTLEVSGPSGAAIREQAKVALTKHLNSIPLGQSVSYTALSQVAYNVSPYITNVSPGYTLNGLAQDLSITAKQVCKAGTVTVN